MTPKARSAPSKKGSKQNELPPAKLDEYLALPFKTEVLTVEVTVERIDMTGDEQIVAVCSRGRSRQRISITEMPLPDPPPKGWEWIGAYRRWACGG